MQKIIDQLILTAGAWQSSGGDKMLERQFARHLNELGRLTNTNKKGAMELLMSHLGENEVEAC